MHNISRFTFVQSNILYMSRVTFDTQLEVFYELDPHFEPLSGPFLEGLCKGQAENGLYYIK